ncbi:membrane-bound ghrelin O-acyltransferase MBOAT4 [Pelodytes ibericus]
MDYILVTFHQVALYQLAAFPFALMYTYLCSFGHLSITTRFMYLLVGGILLACASMGPYSILLFIPALVSTLLFHTVSCQSVHKWAFTLQMSWQTCCHMWLLYKEYYLGEAITIRFSIMISSLMLLTQKITSLAMDIHERKVTVISLEKGVRKGFHHQIAYNILLFISYFMFFPGLLGGPLCSFVKFQQQVHKCRISHALQPIWMAAKGCGLAFSLQMLRALVFGNINFHYTLISCRGLYCVYSMWTTALQFKLTYYSHWILDESLFHTAGFVTEVHHGTHLQTTFTDVDIWTVETTYQISVFARTWNKSTATWLKRLVFKKCKIRPLFMTFAFSAWWHGLYPGQVLGFLCWALMVEIDYRIHKCLSAYLKTWYARCIYKTFTWVQTQLIIAFIIIVVEMRSFAMVWSLCSSCNSIFPILYCVSMIFLTKIK